MDKRFHAALRIDPLLNLNEGAYAKLREWGYAADTNLSGQSVEEIKRFLKDWIGRMNALYVAASLPPTFCIPEKSGRSRVVEECIIPVCRELNKPFAMMIGVNKLVNPALGDAGDSSGVADINTVAYLCQKYPKNKFLVTMLSLENQHELAVCARKFGNLMVFGCWWFLNNPSIIDKMTRMRLELLGLSFVPQTFGCKGSRPARLQVGTLTKTDWRNFGGKIYRYHGNGLAVYRRGNTQRCEGSFLKQLLAFSE